MQAPDDRRRAASARATARPFAWRRGASPDRLRREDRGVRLHRPARYARARCSSTSARWPRPRESAGRRRPSSCSARSSATSIEVVSPGGRGHASCSRAFGHRARCRAGGRERGRPGDPSAGRDRHGSRRPRQDLAARRTSATPTSSRARPAASRSTSVPTRSRPRRRHRASHHLHRHPGSRGVHRHACPWCAGHRHRDPGGRGRRRRHAADQVEAHQPRAGGQRADRGRGQQGRQARRPTRTKVRSQLYRVRPGARGVRRRRRCSSTCRPRPGRHLDELLEADRCSPPTRSLDLHGEPGQGRRRASSSRRSSTSGRGPVATILVQSRHAPGRRLDRRRYRPTAGSGRWLDEHGDAV